MNNLMRSGELVEYDEVCPSNLKYVSRKEAWPHVLFIHYLLNHPEILQVHI